MSKDSKSAWGGFNGFQPVSHQAEYSGAAYMAPIILNDGAWEKIKEVIHNAKLGEFYYFDADGNVINKKEAVPSYTLEDVRKLQKERDELAATVEAFRATLEYFVSQEFEWNNPNDSMIDDINRLLELTPQQHLRDVRAEAVTECQLIVARATTTYRENPGMGFSSTIEDKTARQLKQEIAKELEQYAEQLKSAKL